MDVTFYLADVTTGDLYGRALPLEQVRLASSFDAGTCSAVLDMRKVARTLEDARQVLGMLRAGAVSLVPVYEGVQAGAGRTTRAMGEWWLHRVEADWADPIIRLTGIEISGYLKHRLNITRWAHPDTDAVYAARLAVGQCMREGQSIAVTTNDWNAPEVRATYDYPAGTRTYWDLIDDIAAGRFEWRLQTRLELDGLVPVRVERWLHIGEPRILIPRDDQFMEAVPVGMRPASVVEVSESWDATATPSALWARGAGSGEDQLSTVASYTPEQGRPVVAAGTSLPDILDGGELSRAAWGQLGAMQQKHRVFQARITRYLPTVGEVYPWERAASWSMPVVETGRVRCVGWSWEQPRGDRDEYVLDLQRMEA